MSKTFHGLIIADFTADGFAGILSNAVGVPGVSAVSAPFGQVVQTLMDAGQACWNPRPDFVVVWTRPQVMIESFGRLLQGEAVGLDEVLAEVDAYAQRLVELTHRAALIFVPSWTMAGDERGLGPLDLKHPRGIARTLAHMNLRLTERLASVSQIFVLNADKWLLAGGKNAFNPKLWYLGKIAFSNEVLASAAKDIHAALGSVSGAARKLVVVDLDDTMWGGIVGDAGWENLRLGGQDAVGEALVDFQKSLKALSARGILLGIVSKNEESVAMEAIEKHPEMVLRQKDFAGWRINWNDKAKNIEELVTELNLGMQSVVFLDDNPAERARVKESFPEVLVPDLPADKTLYPSILRSLRCFDALSLTEEDFKRSNLYSAEQQRKTSQKQFQSMEEWLAGLGLVVEVQPLDAANVSRVAQLLNKTNQMNLSTRRMSEAELQSWAGESGRRVLGLRVEDRHGDYGLTGILGLEVRREDSTLSVADFVLSCRVMGRKIEESMLHIASVVARAEGLRRVSLHYVPTPKNKPCREILEQSRLSKVKADQEPGLFVWEEASEYPKPEFITLKGL